MRIITLIFCTALLVSCSRALDSALPAGPSGGATAPNARQSLAPLLDRQAQPGVAFKHLFSFNFRDGALPAGDLTSLSGSLFSTTEIGGGSDCDDYSPCGTVFKITTSGKETVIHKFGGSGVGAYPIAGLIYVNGSLYGTTYVGGCCLSYGTVFKITTSGKERVLYSFKGAPDGEYPAAGLTNVNGALYGTTEEGGASGDGTVFKVTMSGRERVLHSFSVTDGSDPRAGLTNVNGILYGTTRGGGTGKYGTVFKITTSGKVRVLISFKGANGAFPLAHMTFVGGTLYGTTSGGGAYGLGTVFEVTTSGIEKVLHSFEGGADGAYPIAHLLNVNGELYGTTGLGGGGPCYGQEGCGTVFKITRSGSEVVLHRFQGTDGSGPGAGVTDVNGALYGTTGGGGRGPCPYGCGTVFKLSP
jgi:uncharacterized repeat protein (TIGR03803 family)